MSDLASPSVASPRRYTPAVALVLALLAVTAWILAGIVDDGLYPVSAIVGGAATAVGWKAETEPARGGRSPWLR